MEQAVSRPPPIAGAPSSRLGTLHVGFVVDEIESGYVFLWVLQVN